MYYYINSGLHRGRGPLQGALDLRVQQRAAGVLTNEIGTPNPN